jgi:hypothetical protein
MQQAQGQLAVFPGMLRPLGADPARASVISCPWFRLSSRSGLAPMKVFPWPLLMENT